MATPRYIGAIDQGTSSTRFMLFDHDGNIVARAQREHKQHYPKAGWVEHDPLEIWQRTTEVIAEAMAGIDASEVGAIGITNQRETTVIWDKETGEPLCNAIVWNCTRSEEVADRVAAEAPGGKDRLRRYTGLPIVPYFSATKIVWIFENVPGARTASREGRAIFGTMDTWLIWKLTRGSKHLTDVSNASRTLLMNIKTLEWDSHLLETFEIPACMLPEIVPSSAHVASVDGGVVPALAGVAISGILGDQQAATFGQVCFKVGQAKSTYGTGAFIMMNTGSRAVPSRNGLLTTVGWQRGWGGKPVYCLEGGVAYAGSLIQWVRDNLGLIKHAGESETVARRVENSGDLFFVPAFAGLFAPYWRSDARGIICGMTAFHSAAHVVRAAVEASAFQVMDVLDAMSRDSRVRLSALRCDGGMTANHLLMQFQADVIDATVTVPAVSETTALGAAFAAGLATHFWGSEEELVSLWRKEHEWAPQMSGALRQDLTRKWHMAVERTLNWHGHGAPRGLRTGATAVAATPSATQRNWLMAMTVVAAVAFVIGRGVSAGMGRA